MPTHLPTRVKVLLLFPGSRLPRNEIRSFPSLTSGLAACMVRAGLLLFVLVGLVWVSALQAREWCCVLETARLLADRFHFVQPSQLEHLENAL